MTTLQSPKRTDHAGPCLYYDVQRNHPGYRILYWTDELNDADERLTFSVVIHEGYVAIIEANEPNGLLHLLRQLNTQEYFLLQRELGTLRSKKEKVASALIISRYNIPIDALEKLERWFIDWFINNDLEVPSDLESTSESSSRPSSDKRKKTKPRLIDKYPELQPYIKRVFPEFRRDLYREFRLLTARIIPDGMELNDERKKYLINAFIVSARRNMPETLRNGFKVTNPKPSEQGEIILLHPRK